MQERGVDNDPDWVVKHKETPGKVPGSILQCGFSLSSNQFLREVEERQFRYREDSGLLKKRSQHIILEDGLDV